MLAIDGVSYRYREAGPAALDAVSLDIPAGGVYGLLGPNGAGKTTLISLLAGLLAPNGGTITLDGRPLAEARAADRRAIALVPQDYAFYPMLTAGENLRFFAGVLGLQGGEARRQVDAAIAFARLEQVVGQRAEQLSGGLRRRLNLAIGLLGRPQLLLLDEPTVGVDPQSRSALFDVVETLRADGRGVLYTTHYMEEAEYCDRLVIMAAGRILSMGDPTAIKTAARSPEHPHPSMEDAFIKLVEEAA